jgi:hypothetical protein
MFFNELIFPCKYHCFNEQLFLNLLLCAQIIFRQDTESEASDGISIFFDCEYKYRLQEYYLDKYCIVNNSTSIKVLLVLKKSGK